MSDVEKYKAMMRQGQTTDYSSNEYVGDQAQAYRKSTGSLNKPKWGKPQDHLNNDWLGSSPTGARRSWKVKSVKDIKAPELHDEDEKPKETPKPVSTEPKKEEPKQESPKPESPKPEEPKKEVDPAIEKYKAMMRQGQTTDYSSNEYVGEQARSFRSPKSPSKKWGNTSDGNINNDWLGSSPTGTRRSWKVKDSSARNIKAPEVNYEDEKPKESPKPVSTEPKKEEEEEAPASPKQESPKPEPSHLETPKKEADPAIEKYKAMMRQGQTTDYSSNEYVGEQAQSYRKSTGSLNKPKWGKANEHTNNDWLGSSPTGTRRSWKVKDSKK